ncbi:hypothetical protein Cantr_10018 [Candida viswanathii]|uniref:Uncharacterized protein n=1 Tax=Candida viswanathii TaxID=5486 RepID=A0A367YCL5_9ASCO|nr:hypothetical protein Cantr_10018 [Candida viswanathii]
MPTVPPAYHEKFCDAVDTLSSTSGSAPRVNTMKIIDIECKHHWILWFSITDAVFVKLPFMKTDIEPCKWFQFATYNGAQSVEA